MTSIGLLLTSVIFVLVTSAPSGQQGEVQLLATGATPNTIYLAFCFLQDWAKPFKQLFKYNNTMICIFQTQHKKGYETEII